MFLSKIMMDLGHAEVVRDLGDRDRLHRKLMLLFPDFPGGGSNNARERMKILYRVEAPVILMQSALEPVTTRIPAGYRIAGIKQILESGSLLEGAQYRFRLEANVCYRENASRRRRALDSEEDQEAWLFRRGLQAGFEVVDYSVETLPAVKARAGLFYVVRFDGVLLVKDAALLFSAIEDGIGPAKAYGYGLLSLRKN